MKRVGQILFIYVLALPMVSQAINAQAVEYQAHKRKAWGHVVMESQNPREMSDEIYGRVRLMEQPAAVVLGSIFIHGYVTKIEVQLDASENPRHAVVSLTDDGILDDDLHAVRHEFVLVRDREGYWTVQSHHKGELRRRHFNKVDP